MKYLMACSTYTGAPQYLVVEANSDEDAIRVATPKFHETVADMIPRSVRIEKRNYV